MKPILGTLLFTILVLGCVTVGIPHILLVYDLTLPFDIGDFRFIGLIPIVLGAVIYIRAALEFAIIGKGTPAPIAPPDMLISTTLYRMVRNPMYVSIDFILVGEVILLTSWTIFIYALLIGLLFHFFIVFYEEPYLRKEFGEKYEEYCRAVPRWFPRLRRKIDSRQCTE